jgi:hypothetical protein
VACLPAEQEVALAVALPALEDLSESLRGRSAAGRQSRDEQASTLTCGFDA